jgi:hypothetical protein
MYNCALSECWCWNPMEPIAGTFANLPDGSIITIKGNNLRASYEGGDGNDLTLTVVP